MTKHYLTRPIKITDKQQTTGQKAMRETNRDSTPLDFMFERPLMVFHSAEDEITDKRFYRQQILLIDGLHIRNCFSANEEGITRTMPFPGLLRNHSDLCQQYSESVKNMIPINMTSQGYICLQNVDQSIDN